MTGTSPSDCLVSYPGYLFEEEGFTSLYSTAPADWAILTWIPSYISIHCNERADKDATIDRLILYKNLIPTIKKFIYDKWQKSWNDQIHKSSTIYKIL